MQLNVAFQIDVHDRVPVVGFHAHQQAVPGDAGVVHQHVDPAGVLYNGAQVVRHSGLSEATSTWWKKCPAAGGFDAFGRGFGRLQVAVVIKIDSRSRSAKAAQMARPMPRDPPVTTTMRSDVSVMTALPKIRSAMRSISSIRPR
jgi:hypothetical protein